MDASTEKTWKTKFLKWKMISFGDYTDENKMQHNSTWSYIPDHPYRILISGGSGWGKINALLNLKNNQPDIEKKIFICKRSIRSILMIICEALWRLWSILMIIIKAF